MVELTKTIDKIGFTKIWSNLTDEFVISPFWETPSYQHALWCLLGHGHGPFCVKWSSKDQGLCFIISTEISSWLPTVALCVTQWNLNLHLSLHDQSSPYKINHTCLASTHMLNNDSWHVHSKMRADLLMPHVWHVVNGHGSKRGKKFWVPVPKKAPSYYIFVQRSLRDLFYLSSGFLCPTPVRDDSITGQLCTLRFHGCSFLLLCVPVLCVPYFILHV